MVSPSAMAGPLPLIDVVTLSLSAGSRLLGILTLGSVANLPLTETSGPGRVTQYAVPPMMAVSTTTTPAVEAIRRLRAWAAVNPDGRDGPLPRPALMPCGVNSGLRMLLAFGIFAFALTAGSPRGLSSSDIFPHSLRLRRHHELWPPFH